MVRTSKEKYVAIIIIAITDACSGQWWVIVRVNRRNRLVARIKDAARGRWGGGDLDVAEPLEEVA